MKTLLIYLVCLLFSVQVWGQSSPAATIRVANMTTAIGQNVPIGFTVKVISDSTSWVARKAVLGTATMNSALVDTSFTPDPTKIKGSTQINVAGLNGHLVLTVPDATITNAKLPNMATKTYKGRTSAGTGVPEDVGVSTLRSDLSINNLDNTSDANKPVSTATQTALDLKKNTSDSTAATGYTRRDRLASQIATRVAKNAAITGATKTKITYDAKGLVTAGADATTTDIAEGTNLYYTDVRVAANSAVTANTAKITNATHTGEVTGATDLTIANDAVTNAKLANVATSTIKGRVTAATGDPEDLTPAQVRTLLNVSDGANTGTVTSISAGTGLTGGTITTTGTLAIDTTVVAKKTTVAAMYLPKRTFGTAANSATTDFAPAFSGMAGYVSMFTGTGATIGNSGFYWDAFNGRGGIGTTEPWTNFSVNGSISVPDNEYIHFGSTATYNGYFALQYHTTLAGLNFLERGVADGRLFIKIGGNVGIANINPPELVTIGTPGVGTPNMSIAGATSGKVVQQAAAVAGTPTITWGTESGTPALISQAITNGVTTKSPSEDVIFDAFALKAPLANPVFTTGIETPAIKITTGAAAGAIAVGDVSGNLAWSTVNSAIGAAKITYGGAYAFNNDRDIVDKAYVDAVAAGNLPKLPVDAATTEMTTLSGASQTIDGFAAIAGSRILVWKQAVQAENGVYIVASGAWTRATDLDTWAELYKAYVAVLEGYQNGSSFVCTIPTTGTLDTDDVTWVLYNVPTNILAGTGLTKTGSTISLNTATSGAIGGIIAGAGITMTGSTASVSTAYDASGTSATHAALTTTAHGLGASAFHADNFFESPLTFSTGLNRTGNAITSTITQYTDALARAAISTTATGLTYTTATGVFSLTSGFIIPTTTEQTNWNKYMQWDGGSTGLVAATGLTSLGGTKLGKLLFKITNPASITFPRFNADSTVSVLSAEAFRTAIGAGTSSATGTVTSVAALTLGTTGTDLGSSVATGTTTPVITLNVPSASAANRGALTAADWSTFNGKQAALGFTPYNATNPSNFIPLTALSSTATGLTYTNTTGVFSLTSGYFIPTTSTLSGTNTGDVPYYEQVFSEFATGATGQINTLTYTPKSGYAVTVSINGSDVPSSKYTVSTNTVQVTIPVYQYDQIIVKYFSN